MKIKVMVNQEVEKEVTFPTEVDAGLMEQICTLIMNNDGCGERVCLDCVFMKWGIFSKFLKAVNECKN